MTFTPGIFQITESDYHSLPYISKSGLDKIAKSPAHYIAYLNEKPEPTPAQILGSAIHAAILEPQSFYKKYVARPDGLNLRTNEGKAVIKAIEDSGKIVLSKNDFDSIEKILEAVYSHPTAFKYISNGKIEHGVFWIDEKTKTHCKAKPDFISTSGVIVDIKSTDDASFDAFQKSIAKYRYHVQAAFYMDGLAQVLNQPQVGFVFIAVEKKPPYAVGVYYLDEASLDVGRALYRRDLDKYAECVKNQVWPAYSQELEVINIPHWAFNEVESA